jgi:hypothetical protein
MLGRISYMRAVPVGERSSAAVLQWGVLRTETESMSGQAPDQALWNSPASDGWLPGGFAGTIQRGLERLTYGMTALLTPARQPIPLHDAIAKAGGTSFLLIAACRQPDETKAASYFPQCCSRSGVRVDCAGRESRWCARHRPAAVGVARDHVPEPDARRLVMDQSGLGEMRGT